MVFERFYVRLARGFGIQWKQYYLRIIFWSRCWFQCIFFPYIHALHKYACILVMFELILVYVKASSLLMENVLETCYFHSFQYIFLISFASWLLVQLSRGNWRYHQKNGCRHGKIHLHGGTNHGSYFWLFLENEMNPKLLLHLWEFECYCLDQFKACFIKSPRRFSFSVKTCVPFSTTSENKFSINLSKVIINAGGVLVEPTEYLIYVLVSTNIRWFSWFFFLDCKVTRHLQQNW